MLEINFTTPITPETSYGIVGIHTVRELVKMGIRVNLFPIGGAGIEQGMDPAPFRDSIDNGQRFSYTAPSVRLFHQFDLAHHVGARKVGWPIFELDNFTSQEINHLKYQDQILVCSEWAKEVVQNRIGRTAFVVPLGVDRTVFAPVQADPHSVTRFVNIGKWEYRKGHDILIRAFNRAFTPQDPVELHMLAENVHIRPDVREHWQKTYQSSPMGASVYLHNRKPTITEVANLINYGDCYVSPSRAEGWDLPLIEALSCGKEVIATYCTAHQQYLTESNAKLIVPSQTELANDNQWFFGQGNWARLGPKEEDQLVEYLRDVHRRKQEGSLTLNQEGVETAEKFSWTNTAASLAQALLADDIST